VSHRTAAFIALVGGGIILLARSGLGAIVQSGNKLSAVAIAGYASAAGFSGDDLVTAVAVALAESGGDPNAHGDLTLPGSGSYGLWQIYAHAHPELGPDFTQLYDPAVNAAAAFSVYSAAGNSFSPWSTFKGGQYAAHLDIASQAINA
jgi:Lysozyme like domain